MTSASALIEVPFHLSAKITIDGFLIVYRVVTCLSRLFDQPNSLGALAFVAKEYLFGQRIGQPKSKEILCSFVLRVWQITATYELRSGAGSRLSP